ncbi:hypothetical protein GMST_00930 [Geomonas silvestris]|uniref:Uncharacterized protein n=1 Tax=Geomonas silvestris TaxID=2740184 RepID=A0A6V8MCQ2_9BACT|nr:hypothetical protein [Geomonas silvestris]GFO57768.1 hypothetical protein GMST_00930 [Geomonas silvestris]
METRLRHELVISLALFIVFSLLCSGKVSWAVGAPDYLPDGPHPRIILNSGELTRLVAKRAGAAAEWTKLVAWCDTHLTDTGYNVQPTVLGYGGVIAFGQANWQGSDYYGYRMSGFNDQLLSYALAYQVLKQPGAGQDLTRAAQYAARVKELLVNGIAKGLNVGEEPNGLRALRVSDLADVSVNAAEVTALAATTETLAGQVSSMFYKLGYSSRFLVAVPIAYDWIYDTLSQQDKDLLAPMMLRWYDWIQGVRSAYNNGVLINGVRYYEDFGGTADSTHVNPSGGQITVASDYGKMYSNFGSGHEAMMSLIPVALYGYNADIPAYFSQTKIRLTTSVVPQLESPLQQAGGESVEGWNYGSGYSYLAPSLYGYYTATGEPAIAGMTWFSGLVESMVHRLGANLLDVPYTGYWTGVPMGVNRTSFAFPFTGILQRIDASAKLAQVGQYLLVNSAWQDTPALYDQVLWLRKDVTSVPPSILPLSHLASGSGIFTSRSSWTDPDGTHMQGILKGVAAQANHEGYSQGHFSLSRGSDRLLSHSNAAGDSPAATTFNTILFNNNGPHASNPALTTPAIDRMEEGGGFFYVSGDITNAYKRQWNTDRALLFRRSLLHVRPGLLVVYDVTRSNATLGNLKDWYTQYTSLPAVTGDTVATASGNSKVFVKTVYPAGSFTVSNPYTGSYRVKFTPATLQEYDQFLHVVEATGTSGQQSAVAPISTANLRGAHIQASRNVVIGFPSDQNGADLGAPISYSYTPTTSATDHYLAKLVPGQTFSVSVTGGAVKTVTLTPGPSSVAASANGVLAFTVNADNSFSQLNVATKTGGVVSPSPQLRGRGL